jgi:hypothetical protein
MYALAHSNGKMQTNRLLGDATRIRARCTNVSDGHGEDKHLEQHGVQAAEERPLEKVVKHFRNHNVVDDPDDAVALQ